MTILSFRSDSLLLTCLSFLAATNHVLSSDSQKDGRAVDILPVVEDGLEANRQAVTRLKCRSSYSYGVSDTFENALEGLGDLEARAAAYYACDGTSERFDLIYPAEVSAKSETIADGRVVSPFVSMQLQENRGRLARFSPTRSQAWIYEGGADSLSAMVRPFDLGLQSMPKGDYTVLGMIRAHRRGELDFSFEGEADLQGTMCWILEFSSSDPNLRYRYWVAPEFGFQPILVKFTYADSGDDMMTIRMDDLVQCDGGTWLPRAYRQAFRIRRGSEVPDSFGFREVRFEEFHTGDEVVPSDLALPIPEGVTVLDTIMSFQWDSSNQSILPDGMLDLQVYDSTEAMAAAGKQTLPRIERRALTARSGSHFWIIIIVNFLFVLLLIFLLIRRRF